MFTVLIDQIEDLDNFSIQSYCVGQVNETNEIIQFSKQKLIDQNRCEWFSNTVAPVNSMLRQYDAVDHIFLFYRFRLQNYTLKPYSLFFCTFVQSYKFIIAAQTWSNKQTRYFNRY